MPYSEAECTIFATTYTSAVKRRTYVVYATFYNDNEGQHCNQESYSYLTPLKLPEQTQLRKSCAGIFSIVRSETSTS
jgi:hypothetical protein